MGLCCCLSLKKGVVAIGVLTMISSSALVVITFVTCITFEEHLKACRLDMAKDRLQKFPDCDLLTDATLLIAGRIFLYIPLLVWIIQIVASIFLLIAAVKKRSCLLVPWIIVSFGAMLVLIWNVYQAVVENNLVQLLLLIMSLLVACYFVVVVISFSVQLSRDSRYYYTDDPTSKCSSLHRTSRRSSIPESSRSGCFMQDFPPAYSVSKGPLPHSLGLKY